MSSEERRRTDSSGKRAACLALRVMKIPDGCSCKNRVISVGFPEISAGNPRNRSHLARPFSISSQMKCQLGEWDDVEDAANMVNSEM